MVHKSTRRATNAKTGKSKNNTGNVKDPEVPVDQGFYQAEPPRTTTRYGKSTTRVNHHCPMRHWENCRYVAGIKYCVAHLTICGEHPGLPFLIGKQECPSCKARRESKLSAAAKEISDLISANATARKEATKKRK